MSTRVFHLIKGLKRGGAEMLLPRLLTHADRERFEYSYGYFLEGYDDIAEDLCALGASVHCFGVQGNIGLLLAMRRVVEHVRAHRIDLIHAHLPLPGTVARLVGKWTGIPVVYSEHNVLELYHPLTYHANKITWGWQDGVVAVSAEVAESIQRHRAGSTQNLTRDYPPVYTIPNGVDIDAFDPRRYSGEDVRIQFGIPAAAPVVGTVAGFRAEKRMDQWLKVARSVKNQHPATCFLLVGDGALRPRLEADVHSLGLSDSVVFAGLQAEVRPYLASMDVFMMSSAYEGLPLALLEAMAMGRGVVCTAVGGIRGAVRHNQDGMLAKAGDVERLASQVSSLINNVEKRQRLGESARERVAEAFSMHRMAADLERVYDEIFVTKARAVPQ